MSAVESRDGRGVNSGFVTVMEGNQTFIPVGISPRSLFSDTN